MFSNRYALPGADLPEVVVKVLITGATGFIGGHLAQALVKEGHQVRALARPTSDTLLLKKLNIEIVNGDLRDAAAMNKAVGGCQCVYHLAAKTTKDHLPKEQYHAHNVEGTINVARAALNAGVNRLVFASSVGVYGTFRDSSIDENSAPNPDSYYREAKLAAEKEVLRLHRESGLPVVVARLGGVYGPGTCSWLGLCRKILTGNFRVIGAGENYDHMGYVDDVVEGIRRCGEATGVDGRTYIITGPEPAKLRQWLEMIAQELGADSVFGSLPAPPFRIYQRLGRLVHRSLGIELPRAHYYDLFFMNHRFITTKAQEELGYFPTMSLKDGFRRLLEWYREKGYLPPLEGVQALRAR